MRPTLLCRARFHGFSSHARLPHFPALTLNAGADEEFERFLEESGQQQAHRAWADMTSDEEHEDDDDASEGRTSFLETEYSHAYSSDAVAEELACALKIRLTELQLWQQGGRSGKPGFVSFWWCCDGARSSGCPETVRLPQPNALLCAPARSLFRV
eukprot:COSAG04_NODE_6750_length_1263_cov_1.256014_1_plen_156_part_00